MNGHKSKAIRRLAKNTVALWPKEHAATAFINPPDTFRAGRMQYDMTKDGKPIYKEISIPNSAKASPYRRLVKQLKREHKAK